MECLSDQEVGPFRRGNRETDETALLGGAIFFVASFQHGIGFRDANLDHERDKAEQI